MNEFVNVHGNQCVCPVMDWRLMGGVSFPALYNKLHIYHDPEQAIMLLNLSFNKCLYIISPMSIRWVNIDSIINQFAIIYLKAQYSIGGN